MTFGRLGRQSNRLPALGASAGVLVDVVPALARLLGGDLEAGAYSSGEGTIPLRQVAKLSFPVLAMDVAVAPADRIPRMVVSDGDQIYMYKIIEQRMEPEWTKSVRFLGRTISVQLADVDGDGTLEVVGLGVAESRGIKRGVVVNVDAAVDTRRPSSYGVTAARATNRASRTLSTCWWATPRRLTRCSGGSRRSASRGWSR